MNSFGQESQERPQKDEVNPQNLQLIFCQPEIQFQQIEKFRFSSYNFLRPPISSSLTGLMKSRMIIAGITKVT